MFSDSGMHNLQFCNRNTGSYSRTLDVASTNDARLTQYEVTQFQTFSIFKA